MEPPEKADVPIAGMFDVENKMISILTQYLFPATYIPLAGYIPTPAFWGMLIFYHKDIGLVQSIVWGVAWIALLLVFFIRRINPAFYFPIQLIMAILMGMVAWYKVRIGR